MPGCTMEERQRWNSLLHKVSEAASDFRNPIDGAEVLMGASAGFAHIGERVAAAEQLDRAEHLLLEVLADRNVEALDRLRRIVELWSELGEDGRAAAAVGKAREGLSAQMEGPDRLWLLLEMAKAYRAVGNRTYSNAMLEEAGKLLPQDLVKNAPMVQELATLWAENGETARARGMMTELIERIATSRARNEVLGYFTLIETVRTLLAMGDRDQAARALTMAEGSVDAHDDRDVRVINLFYISRYWGELGNQDNAEKAFERIMTTVAALEDPISQSVLAQGMVADFVEIGEVGRAERFMVHAERNMESVRAQYRPDDVCLTIGYVSTMLSLAHARGLLGDTEKMGELHISLRGIFGGLEPYERAECLTRMAEARVKAFEMLGRRDPLQSTGGRVGIETDRGGREAYDDKAVQEALLKAESLLSEAEAAILDPIVAFYLVSVSDSWSDLGRLTQDIGRFENALRVALKAQVRDDREMAMRHLATSLGQMTGKPE